MSEQNTSRDDIAYMRKLAESGRNGPILGGAFQAAAGLVYGLTCFVQWAALSRYITIPRDSFNLIWLLASVLVAVLGAALYRVSAPKTVSCGNATTASYGNVWMACGAGLLVSIMCLAVMAYKLKQAAFVLAIPPVAFAFYGAAWWAAAAFTKRPWMYAVALAAFAVSAAIVLMPLNLNLLLVVGAALLLTLALPGLKLMADESR